MPSLLGTGQACKIYKTDNQSLKLSKQMSFELALE